MRTHLLTAATELANRLQGDGKVAILRAVLEGVCAGKSIAQIAREHGKTREHFSRTYWVQATALVAREIAALNSAGLITYHGSRVR